MPVNSLLNEKIILGRMFMYLIHGMLLMEQMALSIIKVPVGIEKNLP